MSHYDLHAAPPAALSPTRPWYWSVHREIWENRSVWIAPLSVGAVVLFVAMASTATLPRKVRGFAALDAAQQHKVLVAPFSLAPSIIMMTTFIVGMFYAVDALYGERRDRSILFWKSLPVSDRTAVLAKASIPLLVLPLIAVVLSVATFFILLAVSAMVLTASGVGAAPLWRELRFVQEPIVMLYGLTVHALWFAPIYAWLLLVSAWARRTPFLWAFLPPLVIAAFESLTFRTTYFVSFLRYRWIGAMELAFVLPQGTKHIPLFDQLSQLTPLKFLSSAGLWLGLLFAAACLIAAIRLRRRREPV